MASGLRKSTAKRGSKVPRCLLIAGPNGAGKTTFAREYLPNDARVLNFINADLIAAGLSPLAPQQAAIAAARVMLAEIDRLSTERIDFAFESTLSGQTYARRLQRLRDSGYDIEISGRVRQGGHPVPKADVLRRFVRGWDNFQKLYRPLAHVWSVYDNSDSKPRLIERGP